MSLVTDDGSNTSSLWVLVSSRIDVRHVSVMDTFCQQITIGISNLGTLATFIGVYADVLRCHRRHLWNDQFWISENVSDN